MVKSFISDRLVFNKKIEQTLFIISVHKSLGVSLNELLRGIAQQGGIKNFEKNGSIGNNEEKRKIKWKEWWNTKGRFIETSPIFTAKKIKEPNRNVFLAEFVGIMLGDGGVAPYHISITLDSKTDNDYGKF